MKHKISLNLPIRVQMFMKDYRLPLWSTTVLVIILVLLTMLRTYERGILAGVLGERTSSGQSYANLITGDNDAELQKNEIGEEQEQPEVATTSSQPTSITIDTTGGSTTTTTTTSGDSSSGGSTEEPPADTSGNTTTPPPPPPPPPPAPFSASIAGFGLRSQSGPFYCGSGSGSDPSQWCKQYDFIAGVNTFNGPGAVSYVFRWFGVAPGESPGMFQAATGDAFTQVNRAIKLRCNQMGNYAFKFILLQPTAAESHFIPIEHNCSSTTPPPSP